MPLPLPAAGRPGPPPAAPLPWIMACLSLVVLLASLAYLVRIKRAAQEVNVLVLVLLAFVFDAFAIQHFLGWDEPSACLYAGASAASGLLILAGLAISSALLAAPADSRSGGPKPDAPMK